MKKFKLNTLCRQSGIQKADGYSAIEVLTLLLMLPLMALKNVHQLYKSEYGKRTIMQKDALYRLKNNERYSWRNLLYAVAKTFKKQTEPENKAKGSVTAFILDDTSDKRTGYKIENISYVFDHVIQKSVLGFKVLVLGYFDGKSFNPLDFTVHQEKKLERKKAKAQYKKQVSPQSPGAKRRKESKTAKTKTAVDLIKRAVKKGFIADYVLCDAWFTSEALIAGIRNIKNGAMNLIAGVKNGNQKYGYKGDLFNVKEIIALLKSSSQKPHRCRSMGIYYYETVVTYKSIGKVKLYMCRYPRQKKWRVFISTNTTLSLTAMMKVYSTRWTIEVFFRECKQYLQLGRCQSHDFDAQIASITMTFMLYIFLSYLKRRDSYETLGELFRLTQQDICEKNMAEKLWALFEEMLALMIDAISAHGAMDITSFKQSQEYSFIREIFESSFLFSQLKTVNNSA
jgi:IS4 transposase